jgi:hypothetical protein
VSPFSFQDWALEIRPDGVTFASFGLSQVITLLRDQFLIDGRCPTHQALFKEQVVVVLTWTPRN